jgi:hypothetical protein
LPSILLGSYTTPVMLRLKKDPAAAAAGAAAASAGGAGGADSADSASGGAGAPKKISLLGGDDARKSSATGAAGKKKLQPGEIRVQKGAFCCCRDAGGSHDGVTAARTFQFPLQAPLCEPYDGWGLAHRRW